MISKPFELDEAETVLRLCREFHQLPSAVLAEDAYLLKLLRVETLGTPAAEPDEGGGVEE